MRLIDLDKVEVHKQLESNGNGIYKAIQVVYKNDLENLEVWTPEEVTLWYLTQNNITRIDDTRKGYEKTYKLVQYGRWEDCSNGWMCSVCEHDARKDYSYCPNCGAKMEV